MKQYINLFGVFLVIGVICGCVPVEVTPIPTEIPTQTIETQTPIPEPTSTLQPTVSPTKASEPYTIRISFFPDMNANGVQDTLEGNGKQAQYVSYSDLVVGKYGQQVDERWVDEVFESVGFSFSQNETICLKIKDEGEVKVETCHLVGETVEFSIDGALSFSESASAFLTISGLNVLGIGYVAFLPQEMILPINAEYAVQTTTYEQKLGDQSNIIIKLPLSVFLEQEFKIGLKQGNHVLPFLPVDLPNLQIRNGFDFSPDPEMVYSEFGIDNELINQVNGKDGNDFYPVALEDGESVLILAGMSGMIVFTDLPARGVIEMCPALDSQKSCTSLVRNQEHPDSVMVNVGGLNIGNVDSEYLFMEPGVEVDPGFPIAVMGNQGFDAGEFSLQYVHRYRFDAHNALPMVEISQDVIDGLDLRGYPDAYIEETFIERCSYSIFTVDPSKEWLLGFPQQENCQIPFFSWAIYGDEIFVPLPDAEIVLITP